jgi:hypothetical protein
LFSAPAAGVAEEVVEDVAEAAGLLLVGLEPSDERVWAGGRRVEVLAQELEVELHGREGFLISCRARR